jgi:hypothetical protein
MTEQETTPEQAAPVPAQTTEFKKEVPAKVVISEDELKALEAKVLGKKHEPTEADLYKKALAEVRSELEASRKQSLEEATKVEQARMLSEMKAEIEALKNRPSSTGRKGFAALPQHEKTEGLIRKQPDGRLAIPVSELEAATRAVMFKRH